MQRFLAEYYDADNKLLRPQQHYAKCPACRVGGDCGRRPPPFALHDSDDLRRECYRRQKYAYDDVYSRGNVTLWADYEGVDATGAVSSPRSRGKRVEEMRPRAEAGDYSDVDGSPHTAFHVLDVRRRKK